MAGAYTGAAARQARMSARPPVPGVNSDHITPHPEPDPFNPAPGTPLGQQATIWGTERQDAGQSNQPNLAQVPVTHWWQGAPPVPTNVPEARADQEFQDRFVFNHLHRNVIPDPARIYRHATQGHMLRWEVGRLPREAGITVPENARWALAGKNGYDQTNEPNEVYQGAAPNVGRYRLGEREVVFGLYAMPLAKIGQDAQLHAYEGLHPQMPMAQPRQENTAPYTPNSRGTEHWAPAPPSQVPSMFALPSETAVTDYAVVDGWRSDFSDRGEFF